MTKLRLAIATLVLAGSLGTAAAAPSIEADVQADAAECAFVAEIGGYRCEEPTLQGSLATPTENKRKLSLSLNMQTLQALAQIFVQP